LQGEGLVTLTPNYGARVRSFDSTFIAELYELRAELHAFAHRSIFSEWDPTLPDKLTAVQETYEQALERADPEACQVANINFHELVNRRCTNSEVMRVLQSQEHLVRTLRSALGYSTKRLREQGAEHWLLIHAIRRRDMFGAMAIARQHAINAGADVIDLLETARAVRPAD
jgi:DNA-binding GntR family transcriptional regulator